MAGRVNGTKPLKQTAAQQLIVFAWLVLRGASRNLVPATLFIIHRPIDFCSQLLRAAASYARNRLLAKQEQSAPAARKPDAGSPDVGFEVC